MKRTFVVLTLLLLACAAATAQTAPPVPTNLCQASEANISGANLSCSGMSATTTGNTLFCMVAWNSSTTISSVTIVAGTTSATFASAKTRVNQGSLSQHAWVAQNITGGTAPTIRVTFAAAPARINAVCAELSNVPTTGVIDQYGFTTGSGTTMTATTAGSVAQSNELVLTYGGDMSATTTFTTETGYTQLQNPANLGRAQFQAKSSTALSGTVSSSVAITSGSTSYNYEVFTIKGATPAASGRVKHQTQMY